MFIKILTGFFLILICYLIINKIYYFDGLYGPILEGLESGGDSAYKDYSGEDPLILGKQNAGNIAALKNQMDDILALKQEVTDMSLNMVKMSGQINDFASAQSEKSDELVGTEEPVITEEDVNEEEDVVDEEVVDDEEEE